MHSGIISVMSESFKQIIEKKHKTSVVKVRNERLLIVKQFHFELSSSNSKDVGGNTVYKSFIESTGAAVRGRCIINLYRPAPVQLIMIRLVRCYVVARNQKLTMVNRI